MNVPTRRTAGLLLAATLALAACGGASAPGTGAPQTGSEPGAAPGAESSSALPAVDVVDIATGGDVALASVLPADKPVLVWMWAPH